MLTHVFRHSLTRVIVFVTGFLTLGCSLFSDKDAPSPTAGAERTDAQIFVGDTIEMNYDPNVIMKRAESFHEIEGYAEAIVEYQHFLDLHRNHVLAPYAQYRLALSHFKMIQTIDRDVTPVKKAREEFLELITVFQRSQYEAEARVKIKECERHLAQNDFLVGTFYYRKEQYLAAAKRFEKIVDNYPNMEEAVQAKLELAKSYEKLGALEWARDWAVALVQQHPRHTLRDAGIKFLATLQEKNTDFVVVQSRDFSNQNMLKTSFLPTTNSPVNNEALYPSVASRTPSTMTDCQLGTWCEGTGTSLSRTLIPTPSASVTCRPGTWCE